MRSEIFHFFSNFSITRFRDRFSKYDEFGIVIDHRIPWPVCPSIASHIGFFYLHDLKTDQLSLSGSEKVIKECREVGLMDRIS